MLPSESDSSKHRCQRRYSADDKLKIINRSNDIGNMAASEEFGVTRNSIRIWKKEYQENGLVALMPKKSRPNHSPKKTSQWVVDKIIDIKKDKPEMGSKSMSEHLKRFESINLSSTTIRKLFNKNKLKDGDAGYAENSYMVKGDKDKQLEKNIEADLGEWERFSRPNPNE